MFHKRLMKEFSDNRKYIAGMVVSQWISLLANVVLMFVLAQFICGVLPAGIPAEESGGFSVEGEISAGTLAVVFAAVLFFRCVATTIGSRLSFAASTQVKRRLRERIYEKLMRLGASYREVTATSEAVQVCTEGVDQLEIYFGKYVPQFFYSLLAPLTLFAIVGMMSPKVAAVLLLCVPLIPVSIVAVQKFAKKLLAKYWGTYTELGDSFLENLQGLTTLKIYQADGRYAKKMDEEAEQFRKVTMRVLIMQLNSISVMDIVAYGGAALGIILSILELRAGNITVAECFFIIMISAEFFLPLRLLGSFFHIAMNGNAAADKIFKLLDTSEPKDGTVTEISGNAVEFTRVDFGYTEEKQILREVSFEIPEKSFVALVGTSGCGKSTIASLIMGENRLSENSGSIKLGGVEQAQIAGEALYRKVTRVRHDSYLFAGTVRENLAMGFDEARAKRGAEASGNANMSARKNGGAQTPCDDDAVMCDALRAVDLYDTIMEKGGLSMQIEEKASNLSGGQKQRLVLARALLHDSDIYIFDEATSNIDAESENKIMEVVHELAHKKTVILISHRLANVVAADRIYVMQDGCIKEQGTHENLMRAGGYYRQLYRAQRELEQYSLRQERKDAGGQETKEVCA